ncbi:hypothetical protein TorRG33x02_305020, partial [Trema orientale]
LGGLDDGSKSSPTLPRAEELIVRVPIFTSALAIRDAVSSSVLKRPFRISPGFWSKTSFFWFCSEGCKRNQHSL